MTEQRTVQVANSIGYMLTISVLGFEFKKKTQTVLFWVFTQTTHVVILKPNSECTIVPYFRQNRSRIS